MIQHLCNADDTTLKLMDTCGDHAAGGSSTAPPRHFHECAVVPCQTTAARRSQERTVYRLP